MKITLKNPVQFRTMLMERGYSQRQFSKEIGASEAYLNQIINQRKHPSPDIANRITKQLQLEFYDLFIIQ